MVVALQQFQLGKALLHSGQFARQVVRIGYARIASTRAKGADSFYRITQKEYPANAQLIHALASVGIRPDPHDLHSDIRAKLALQALAHHVFTAHVLWVCIGCHLVVNTPHIIGHQVLPDGAIFVERRFNPGVALHGRMRCEAHIGNAPAIITFLAFYCGPYPLVERAVPTGRINDMISGNDVVTGWRCDRDQSARFVLRKRYGA